MTEEEKHLLLIDLCGRLPYGVKIMFSHNGFRWDWEQTLNEITKCEDGEYAVNGWGIHGIKPYLRPMSSMIDEEKKELNNILEFQYYSDDSCMCESTDWLISHHFDYRGLIDKGLALEAPEGMYKTK